MELQATIKAIAQHRSGLKQDQTPWYLRDITLTVAEPYTTQFGEEKTFEHTLIATVSGDMALNFPFAPGDQVTAYINFSTHEYKGREYQNINCRHLSLLSPAPFA